MKTVCYSRVSTINQKIEGTITLQEHSIKHYCQNHNLNLVRMFKDDGVSGGLENRPALSELFTYLEKNRCIKNVVIWKLDRLARDLYLQEHLIRKLEGLGVSLISTKEPNLDSSDPMRKAFRQFMGIVSELEKSFITMRLTSGRISKAKKGEYSGGRPAFGYTINDGAITINPNKAKTIKEIYTMKRYKRMSLHEIANKLNKQNITTANNKKWYASTVKYILDNMIYKGTICYKGIQTKTIKLNILTT